MKWKMLLLSIARGAARAFSLGLIGRGEKTRRAGEVVGGVLDDLSKEANTEKGASIPGSTAGRPVGFQ